MRIYEGDENLKGKMHIDIEYDDGILSVYKKLVGEPVKEEIFNKMIKTSVEYQGIGMSISTSDDVLERSSLSIGLTDFSIGSYNIKSIDFDDKSNDLDIVLF